MSADPNEPEQAGDPAVDTALPDLKLLELLVCPLTKTTLALDRTRLELVSRAAGLAFPVRDGVAMMTVEAARRLDDQETGPRPAGRSS